MSSKEEGPPEGNQEGQHKNKQESLYNKLSNPDLPVNPVNIPNELKDIEQWVAWKLKARNGQLTKPPVSISDGRPAATNDPGTWGSFERVMAYFESNRRKGIKGIGFVLTKEDPYCGIDIDNCRDPKTGIITQLAKETIDFFGSYTEISPSGTGIHIIIKGKLPKGRRRNTQLGVEVYDSGRYFTVTGNILWV